MIDQHNVSLGALLVWGGMILGGFLLISSAFTGIGFLGLFGLALMGLAAMHAIQRTVQVRETLLREAFETGRAHERGLAADRASLASVR